METETQRGKDLAQRDRGAQWDQHQATRTSGRKTLRGPRPSPRGHRAEPPASTPPFPKAGLQPARLWSLPGPNSRWTPCQPARAGDWWGVNDVRVYRQTLGLGGVVRRADCQPWWEPDTLAPISSQKKDAGRGEGPGGFSHWSSQ